MTDTFKQTHRKLTAISQCESSGEYGVSSHLHWVVFIAHFQCIFCNINVLLGLQRQMDGQDSLTSLLHKKVLNRHGNQHR